MGVTGRKEFFVVTVCIQVHSEARQEMFSLDYGEMAHVNGEKLLSVLTDFIQEGYWHSREWWYIHGYIGAQQMTWPTGTSIGRQAQAQVVNGDGDIDFLKRKAPIK
ncbi:hypothetical protein YC2023_033365 [Brassica napus]